MDAPGFRQANDVYACLCDGRLVFLHLVANKYFCLGKRHTEIALTLLGSDDNVNSRSPAPERESANEQEIDSITRAMLKRGIFEPATNGDKPLSLAQIEAATRVLPQALGRPHPRVRARHSVEFSVASLSASWQLRRRSMIDVVRSVRWRKQHQKSSGDTDWAELRELVSTFFRMRPFFPRRYLCLYDSLALIEFLARFHQFPQWVFGVTAEPFRAHCWVQEHDVILNDSLDFARCYTPIMSV